MSPRRTFESRTSIAAAAPIATAFCASAFARCKTGRGGSRGPDAFRQKGACRLVAGVLQGLAGLELRLIRRRDGHRFAGARVAAGRRLALADRERPETDETDFAALLQRRGDRVENGLDRLARVALGEAARVSDGGDQVLFVHA